MNWTTPVIATILAGYGWWLIVQHAKYREASELYASIILLLEQLATEGKNAWEKNPTKLDQHAELKFLLLLEAVEQRLRIIRSHYSNLGKSKLPSQEQIWRLRHFLTAVPLKFETEISRSNGILRLTYIMISYLLDENYRYVGKGRQCSAWVGVFILILCVLIALSADFMDSQFELLLSSLKEFVA